MEPYGYAFVKNNMVKRKLQRIFACNDPSLPGSIGPKDDGREGRERPSSINPAHQQVGIGEIPQKTAGFTDRPRKGDPGKTDSGQRSCADRAASMDDHAPSGFNNIR